MKLVTVFLLMILVFSIAQAQPEFVWAKNVGSAGNSTYCYGIAVDSSGNVYSIGNFWGTVDFDPGSGVFPLTSNGNDDVFVCKFDPSGNFLWAFKIGGSSADYGYDITIDDQQNVCITGVFYSTVDFDPGAGTYSLTSAGGWDVFVAKYNPSGDFLWARKMGGTASDFGYAVTTDPFGNILCAGWFGGTADFDPGAGVFNLASAGGNDIFVCKLNSSGNFQWAKQMGGSGTDRANAVVADEYGNVYAGGYFEGSADFNPTGGGHILTSSGMTDLYACKLDSGGNFVWASAFGGPETDWCYGIDVDSIGNVYTTGTFTDSADFDPGAGIYKLISNGSMDVYVNKLDPLGQFVWASHMGGIYGDIGRSVKVDDLGFIHSTGYYSDSADFDPGASVFNLNSVSGSDIYASTLDSAGMFFCAGSMGGTGSTEYGMAMAIDNDGFAYYAGSFSGTADFDPGSATFNLASTGTTDAFFAKLIACSPCVPTASDTVMSVCTGFVSPSGNYVWTLDGVYTDTIPNAAQCDSVITFYLTILDNTYGTINPTVCDNYTTPSGNNTYSVAGTYYDTIPNAAGCDSIITINLSIAPPDTSVSVVGTTLTANAVGALYQWVDCNNAFMTIPVATNQSFTPSQSGSYAVVVYQYGCFEMSSCYNVIVTGISETDDLQILKVFPNPADGVFSVEYTSQEAFPYEILDIKGRIIQTGILHIGINTIDLQEVENGSYFLRTRFSEIKLIKQN
ncbi:MAG: hypothetical protein C0592_06445 [Marinilabiliales bacterium]|nr:MAG: hypothetical protein C0592_06445 [Marinilabiliales bacterium]